MEDFLEWVQKWQSDRKKIRKKFETVVKYNTYG